MANDCYLFDRDVKEIAVILPGDGDQIKQSQGIILYCTFRSSPLSIQKPLPSVGLKNSPLECASVVQGQVQHGCTKSNESKTGN